MTNELKTYSAHIFELGCMDQQVYLKDDASKFISNLEESNKKEVEQLLMKIAGLEKLVETADKLVKQKGGFTVKDIEFNGVKLEGLEKEDFNDSAHKF